MSRRIILSASFLMLLLTLSIVPFIQPAQAQATVTRTPTAKPITGYVSKGAYLILRETPRTFGREIAVLKRGEQFTVFGVDRARYWVKIKTASGQIGWVSYFNVLLSVKRNLLPVVS